MTQALRTTLLRTTIDLTAGAGLESLSLRQVAKAAGVSTTAIFQNFDSKAALLAAAVEFAIEAEAEFHAGLASGGAGLVATPLALADLMALYVCLQARRREALFLREVVIKLNDHPDCAGALAGWLAVLTLFWEDRLATIGGRSGSAGVVAGALLMECIYAQVLQEDPTYRLLLAETCRAICTAVAGRPAPAAETISARLGVTPFAVRPPAQPEAGQPGAEQLLDAAVQIINTAGMRALNQRALAARAGLSGSLIAYHFGDMKTLTIQAIWRALVQGIPAPLDPAGDPAAFPQSVTEWFDVLEAMLVPGEAQRRGFYTGVSQLSAEACLLAVQNPELVPLIHYLRGLEGWGTYRVSQALDAAADRIGRDQAAAFGVWIKSEALLRTAGIRGEAIPVNHAVACLFGSLAP